MPSLWLSYKTIPSSRYHDSTREGSIAIYQAMREVSSHLRAKSPAIYPRRLEHLPANVLASTRERSSIYPRRLQRSTREDSCHLPTKAPAIYPRRLQPSIREGSCHLASTRGGFSHLMPPDGLNVQVGFYYNY